MKKAMILCVVAAAMLSFGCGRDAQFGVVDMNKVQTESQVFKDATKDLQTKGIGLWKREELNQEAAGKSQEEAQKILTEKSQKMHSLQPESTG